MGLLNKVENNQFSIKLYDKRHYFSFSMVRMPYLRSNIPSKLFYSTRGSEISRTITITSSKPIFLMNSKKLVTRMGWQGGRIKIFCHTLAKVFGRHFQTFQKFFPTYAILQNY